MTIELVKIRATISVGNGLTVSTPYIQSFNVRKSRGQLSTFDASLKVEHSQITGTNTGGGVVIQAGTDGNLIKIYTGIIKKSTISPCWDDPGYVLLNISGTDELSKLQGKKYTRRCRATQATWISINSVTREGLRDGKFDTEFDAIRTDPGKSSKAREEVQAPVINSTATSYTSPGETPILVNITQLSSDTEVV